MAEGGEKTWSVEAERVLSADKAVAKIKLDAALTTRDLESLIADLALLRGHTDQLGTSLDFFSEEFGDGNTSN